MPHVPSGRPISVYLNRRQLQRLADLRHRYRNIPAADGAAVLYLAGFAMHSLTVPAPASSAELLREVAKAVAEVQQRAVLIRETLEKASQIFGRARFSLLDAHKAFEDLYQHAGTLGNDLSCFTHILSQLPGAVCALHEAADTAAQDEEAAAAKAAASTPAAEPAAPSTPPPRVFDIVGDLAAAPPATPTTPAVAQTGDQPGGGAEPAVAPIKPEPDPEPKPSTPKRPRRYGRTPDFGFSEAPSA